MTYNTTSVTTGVVRLSYVNLVKPYAFSPDQEPKYSTTILIPKTDTETKANLDAAIEAATQRGVAERWNGVRPPIVPNPLYDGDGVRPSDGQEFGDECKGHWVMTASSKEEFKPQIVDANMQDIIDPTEIYSGMYARVHVTFFPYMFGGKKGIGCGLGPVQKVRDGEALGGGAPKAKDVFSKLPQAQQGTQAVQGSQDIAAMVNPITGLPY